MGVNTPSAAVFFDAKDSSFFDSALEENTLDQSPFSALPPSVPSEVGRSVGVLLISIVISPWLLISFGVPIIV